MLKKTEKHSEELDSYWKKVSASYSTYPSVRHRQRWIINEISKIIPNNKIELKILDYGCGEGSLNLLILNTTKIKKEQIFGYDLSNEAVKLCNERLQTKNYTSQLHTLEHDKFDIIICSEVIEHTKDYEQILSWIYKHLTIGGYLLLSTQAGRIHLSDRYVGHTQHFKLDLLKEILSNCGFKLTNSKSWGFPFFTIQKYLTNFSFESIKTNFLESKPNLLQKVIFTIANLVFFLHDLIPFGPQIFITARKS